TMTSSSETTQSPSTVTASAPMMISKQALRTLERNSSLLFGLASSSHGSQVSRVSLACNELLREIAERAVDKQTLQQLEFYVLDQRLKEEAAEPLVFLAKSIIAMGRSIAGLEDTVSAPSPSCSLKPPLDFGDGDDGAEHMLSTASESWSRTHQIPLFRNDEPTTDADTLNTSDNTETSASSGEKDKPVSAANDWCAKIRAVHKFRPLTPEGEIREERSLTPSPPPSPTLRALLKRRMRDGEDEEEEDEEDYYDDNNAHLNGTTTSSSMEKDGLQCPMCDTFFYAQHQLNSHLVGYHRMKASFDDTSDNLHEDLDQQAASVRRPVQHSVVGGSAAIVSTRPLDEFMQQQQRRQSGGGGGTAQVRAMEQIRLSSTTVTSPGGTIRHYSSPSNAARAAAKAAAAAAAGIFRPNAPSKPYTCRQCGIVLTSQQMYASHVRYNHPKEKGEGGTPAPRQKSSSDRNKETAIVHLQLDDGTKAFKCRRCEKVFDSAQKVAGHSRHCLLVFEGKARPANQGPVPTEDRPYTVYRCGLNSDLARTCPYCGELLPSIRKVDKHVRLVHEAGRHEVYGCSTCDRRFVTLGGIENHWLHYGDCPHGVLTVHKDGVVTCADIGEIPPPLKRPKLVLQEAAAARKRANDDDPSVSIVNAILGAHGFKVKNPGNAPDLSPEMDDSELMEDGEEEEMAPDLDEYGEGEEEMLNGNSHLDDEGNEEEEEMKMKGREKIIVSMKLITCRMCNFAARTRNEMDSHMIKHHPDSLIDGESVSLFNVEEEDGLPMTPGLNDDEMNGSVSPQINEAVISNGETNQTGEMRRMLGITSD
ncbi:hypothetical protein PENTCL1PPCAC_12344, partial [Pristionchus entomophagus]